MLVHQNVSVCVATSPRPLIKIDANRTGHEGHRPLNQAAPTSYVRHPRPNQVPQRHRSACHRPLCSRARPTRQDGAAGTRPLAQPLRVGPGAGQGKPGWRQLRPRRRPHQVRPPAVPADRRPRGQLPRGSWSLPPRTVRPKVSAVMSWCSRLRRSTIEKNARTVQVMRPPPKNAHKTPAAATAETPKSGLEITTVTVCRSSRTMTVFSYHPARLSYQAKIVRAMLRHAVAGLAPSTWPGGISSGATRTLLNRCTRCGRLAARSLVCAQSSFKSGPIGSFLAAA